MIFVTQGGVFSIWDGVFDIGVGMIGSVARSMDQFIAEVDIFGIFGIIDEYLL